jgi:hypothetical protein
MATLRSLRPQYTIQFSIGEIDLTMRVDSIYISNSIKTVYPVITINFNMTAKDYFLDKIYGQQDAFLEINVTGESVQPGEKINLNLIVIHMDIVASNQADSGDANTTSQLEDKVKVVCLLKEPYLALSTTINFIFNEESKKNGQGEFSRLTERVNNFNVINASGLFDAFSGVNQISDTITSTVDSFTGAIQETRLNSDGSTSITNLPSGTVSEIMRTGGASLDVLTNGGGFGMGSVGNSSIKNITDQFNKARNQNSQNTKNANSNKSGGENTPLSIVKTLLDKYVKDITKNIIDRNMNETKLKQLVVPPKSVIGCIRYLNDRYGIYKGPLFIYCDFDNNINMWDISTIAEQDILYSMYFLAPGKSDSDIMKKSSEEDNVFYTFKPLAVKNKTNTSVMTKGYEHIVIKRPRNKFTDTVKKNLDDISQTFQTTQNPELIFNTAAKGKKIIHTTVNANSNEDDQNDSYLTSKMAAFIASASTVSFEISGSKLPIKKLSSVGKCVEIIPQTTEYLPSGGKYIIGSSIISLSRSETGHYVCRADITCFRESLDT